MQLTAPVFPTPKTHGTVINRTSKPLTFMFDGKQYILPPGETPNFWKVLYAYAKQQNPRNGTGDIYNPIDFESLVGWKGGKDPVTPCEQDLDAVSVFDISQYDAPPRGSSRVVRGRRPNAHEARFAPTTDIDGSGVGPDA